MVERRRRVDDHALADGIDEREVDREKRIGALDERSRERIRSKDSARVKGPRDVRGRVPRREARQPVIVGEMSVNEIEAMANNEALDALVNDPETSVEDALGIVAENNLKVDIPFVARIGAMATKMQSLTESQIERLKSEKKVQVDIKRLQKVCASVLEKMGVGD